MSGNSDYEWHHSPDAIRSHVASGEYSIWGTYDQTDDNKLISVFSARKMLGQRGIHVIWGAVDPDCRGRGVWENFGVFIDSTVEKSGAQYGVCWAATTHSLTQQTLEKVGWRPVGFFHGGEFLGGTDGQFYRQSVVWYTKLFNEADQAVQSPRDLVLTEAAENVAKAVMAYGE